MKVSIIITTYNRAHLVPEAINSVLGQSFRDFELIVVDDGSSDNTTEVIKSYGDRIHYIKQKNGGLNNARNRALSVAKGGYIAILDDDDLWLPYKLAVQVKILDLLPEVAYTFSNFSIYKNENDVHANGIQTWFSEPVDWDSFYDKSSRLSELTTDFCPGIPDSTRLYLGDIYYPSLHHYYVLPSTALFRRSMIPNGVQFIEYDFNCGDWDFFARLSRDHPVAYLDNETTYNRSHDDAVRLTRTAWKVQLEFRIDLIERLYMQDIDFYSRYKDETDAVYCDRLKQLCRQQLLSNDQSKAKLTLKKYRMHSTNPNIDYLLLSAASHLPYIGKILQTARKLRG